MAVVVVVKKASSGVSGGGDNGVVVVTTWGGRAIKRPLSLAYAIMRSSLSTTFTYRISNKRITRVSEHYIGQLNTSLNI